MADPEGFLKGYLANFQWRLAQNNVPVQLDTIELLTMNVGSLRKPIQMRIKANGEVEQMAGPAAVGVPYAGASTPILGAQVKTLAPATPTEPTINVAPKPSATPVVPN